MIDEIDLQECLSFLKLLFQNVDIQSKNIKMIFCLLSNIFLRIKGKKRDFIYFKIFLKYD